jgi:RimJ/RimL family protein N-acetyltransferase
MDNGGTWIGAEPARAAPSGRAMRYRRPMSARIRPLRIGDARAFADHLATHVAESGRDGAPHFAVATTVDRDEVRDAALARWSRSLLEPLWGRAFGLFDDAPTGARLVGHLELRGGRVEAELHRAVLSMGLQTPYVGRGHGRELLETAIAWSRDDARLAALELGVFSGNDRARRLYERVGFVPIGVRRDAFRLASGVTVDDMLMELALRPADLR